MSAPSKCHKCDGLGTILKRLPVPSEHHGTMTTETCPDCHGKGYIP